jgi:glycosyltransferase involved in cell wall biosynthesis
MPGRVLFIAYYFPPLGGAGVFRSLPFAKFLPAFGWMPHVLAAAGDPSDVHDRSLLQDIPPGIAVERVAPCWDFATLTRRLVHYRGGWRLVPFLEWFQVPDAKASWLLPGLRRARSVVRQGGIDVLFTTSYPYSSHLIGYWLKRQTGLPWVADFPDEWTNNPHLLPPTRLHQWLAEKMERMVVEQADHVIGVNESILGILKNGTADPTKFTALTNGFDAQEMAEVRTRTEGRRDRSFHLVYTGNFYGARSPQYFLHALEGLLQEGALSTEEIRVRLIGRISQQWTPPQWPRLLEYPGYLAHREALAELQAADCLLLIIPTEHGDQCYTGKLFEYLASGKPILALVPPSGAAASLLRKAGTGTVVAPEDVPAIRSALLRLFQDWKAGRLSVCLNESAIQQYERRHLTKRVADILDQVSGNARSKGQRSR